MKVAIVCFPSIGGSGVVATELGKGLAGRGHEIYIISHEMPFRLNGIRGITYHKVDLKEYPLFPYPLFTLELAGKLVEVINQFSPDVIHAHYALPNSISSLLAREIANSDVKVVTTIHGTDISIWGNDLSMRPLIRYSMEKSDAVTAVSFSLKDDTLKTLAIKKEIQVIYNFVDIKKYKPAVNNDLRQKMAPRGEKIVLHISNFRPVKRIPDLLQAFARLYKIKKDIVLVLAGDGVEKQRVVGLSKELGLERCVKFAGTWFDPAPLFSSADLFVLPSEKESFGLAALEAMACGVPVVAARTGGLPEVIKDGETGFLVPVCNIEALAEAMQRLLEDASLWKQFSIKSREKAKHFSTEGIIPQYERLYKNLIS